MALLIFTRRFVLGISSLGVPFLLVTTLTSSYQKNCSNRQTAINPMITHCRSYHKKVTPNTLLRPLSRAETCEGNGYSVKKSGSTLPISFDQIHREYSKFH